MALLNPVYALIVPFLFVVTIPLAILAGITTTLAFSVLMFRVAVVYVDIAVNMVPQYMTGRRIYPFPRGYTTSSLLSRPAAESDLPPLSPVDNIRAAAAAATATASSSSGQTTPSPTSRVVVAPVRHHRRRRTSVASFASAGSSMTSIEDHSSSNTTATTNGNNNNGSSGGLVSGGGGSSSSKRNSFMMIPSVGMDRDFEGVGGWRLNGRDADDDDAWAQLNSRLELPLDSQRRHHHRSPSGGGATTPGGAGGDYLMMKSPRAKARSKEGSPESGKRGRERKQQQQQQQQGLAMSPNSSRQRTPTSGLPTMPPPLTTMDKADGSYFPPVSPKAARRPI